MWIQVFLLLRRGFHTFNSHADEMADCDWQARVSVLEEGVEVKRKLVKIWRVKESEPEQRGKERCRSMWGMSVIPMNYLKLEIPRPPRGLSGALWWWRGWGRWMEGWCCVRTNHSTASSNPQHCAGNKDVMDGWAFRNVASVCMSVRGVRVSA